MKKPILVALLLAAGAMSSAFATDAEEENVATRAARKVAHPIRSIKNSRVADRLRNMHPIHRLKHAHPIRRLEGR